MNTRVTLLLLALCAASRAMAAPVETIIEGVTYQVLRAPAESVRIVWTDDKGNPLRTFPETARYLTSKGLAVDTLMNGGIFEPKGVPSGLVVQDGKAVRDVNRNAGEGNFFLKPNGIFLIGSKGAAVIGTEEYPLKEVKVQYAVQSGPLLLRHDITHPTFNAGSTSRLHRNGVGVSKKGEVVFAITDLRSAKFPNLHEFAQAFRSLGCEDALFLDGQISQMRSAADMMKPSHSFGSIIAVMQTRNEAKDKPAAPPPGI